MCQRLLLAARAGRGPVRGRAHAPAQARHRALLLLRVPARGQLGAGQLGQGAAVQRAGPGREHAHHRQRRVLRAHALRQALVGGAAHGRGARGGRRAARSWSASSRRRRRCYPGTCAQRRSCPPCASGTKREPTPAGAAARRCATRRPRWPSSGATSSRASSRAGRPRAAATCPSCACPCLGRAIRIFGGWYALCSMCGTLARVSPASRFRGEICCLRCDFAMLAGKAAAEEMRSALPKPPPPVCRFCHKVGAGERRGHEVAARRGAGGHGRAQRVRARPRCARSTTARRTTGPGWLPRTRPCRPRRSSRTW